MTISKPTINFFWPKFSNPQLWKMFANCYHTKIKHISQWMKPFKPFSLSKGADESQSALNVVHVVAEEQEQSSQIPEQDVAAFRPQQWQQPRGQQTEFCNHGNGPRGQGSYRGNSNSRPMQTQGSKASRNGKFCVYCKILNHTQEECCKRMKDNKSCVNRKGQLFWPKINATTKNNCAEF
jgi:hypothetical protein